MICVLNGFYQCKIAPVCLFSKNMSVACVVYNCCHFKVLNICASVSVGFVIVWVVCGSWQNAS